MIKTIPNSWHKYLYDELSKEYFQNLQLFLTKELQNHLIYPSKSYWFEAFKLCSFDELSVIIIGQDPYHGVDQAHGLAFSVQDHVDLPPSLKNIFKELYNDMKVIPPQTGNLTYWAQQGILLLNTILTVRAHQAGSHQNQGWETFTNHVIKVISDYKKNCVFMLWGKHAQSKRHLINQDKHLILQAPHPSPLSAYRGFFECKHFSKTNQYLETYNKKTILW